MAQAVEPLAVQRAEQGGATVEQPGQVVAALGGCPQRDVEGEARALARRALHLDASPHHLHQFLADGQAQAAAAIATGGAGVALGEGLEQLPKGVATDADATVADGEHQVRLALAVAAAADGQGHMALLGEFQGVAQQVHQHLLEACRVAQRAPRHAAFQADVQAQAFLQGLGGEQHQGVRGQLLEIELDFLQAELAGLDARVVEDVVDHRHQGAAGAGDGVHVEALGAVQARLAQQLQHAQHAVQRRTDLVAHLGQETALGLALEFRPLGGLVGAETFFLEQVDAVGQAQ